MKVKHYLIMGVMVLALLPFVIKICLETEHTEKVLSDVLYVGVMNGTTGEYIYISEKEEIDNVVKAIKAENKEKIVKGTGYSYYVDVFSNIKPDDKVRYTIHGNSGDLVSLFEEYYRDSSKYKKSRIYLVDNKKVNANYSIKLRYTNSGDYSIDNSIIDVKDPEIVLNILSYLKEVRFTYNTLKESEGKRKFWIQIYYNDKQVSHLEFDGDAVVKHGEEYIVENMDVIHKLYDYIEQL